MKHTFLSCAVLYFAACLIMCFGTSFQYKTKSYAPDDSSAENPAKFFLITKVSDGDTFWCTDQNGRAIKVRLIGINAPESRNYFKKKAEPFGREASAYANKWLKNKQIRLEFDVNLLDQYGRTLAYAFLSDGTFINEKLVKDGYAVLMTVPPNVKYAERLQAAQQYARKHGRGLWKNISTH